METGKIIKAAGACMLIGMGLAGTAQAKDDKYPSQPINIVVPFAPGGGNDLLAREIGMRLTKTMGQTVVVENQPGAGGELGARSVARAKPDGYTLLMMSNSAVSGAAFNPNTPYDVVKDFASVALVARIPLALAISNEVPAKTVPEFIKLLKEAPDKYNYGSPGQGTVLHASALLFLGTTGSNMEHIPFKGAAPIVTEIIAGRLEATFGAVNSMLPAMKAGQLRLLAIGSKERSAQLPEVPTMSESGVEGYDVDVWYGITAPAGTPPEILKRLNTEIAAVMRDPELKEKLAGMGMETFDIEPPEQMDKIVAQDFALWSKVLKDERPAP